MNREVHKAMFVICLSLYINLYKLSMVLEAAWLPKQPHLHATFKLLLSTYLAHRVDWRTRTFRFAVLTSIFLWVFYSYDSKWSICSILSIFSLHINMTNDMSPIGEFEGKTPEYDSCLFDFLRRVCWPAIMKLTMIIVIVIIYHES